MHRNSGMTAYQCTRLPDFVDATTFWHIGHLSKAVKSGKYDRGDYYSMNPLELAELDKHDTIEEQDDNDEEEDEGGHMPTFAELANVSDVFNDPSKYADISIFSPTSECLEYIHEALHGHAELHGFEAYEHRGVKGRVGKLVVSSFIKDLFRGPGTPEERLDGFVKSIIARGKRAWVFECISTEKSTDMAGRLNPVWWVADELPEAAKARKGSTAPTTRTGDDHPSSKKNRQRAEQFREDVLAVLESEPRGFDLNELLFYAGFEGSKTTAVGHLRKLVNAGLAVDRLARQEDVPGVQSRPEAAKRARIVGSNIYASSKAFAIGEIIPPVPIAVDESLEVPSEEPVAPEPQPGPTPEPEPERPTSVLFSSEDVDRMNRRVEELQLTNDKLLRTCNELLSIINIMKEGAR